MKKINYYDELKTYAVEMFNRNLKIFSQNIYKPIDFVHEAFLLGYENTDEGKKIIRDRIINEKRRLIAKIQQSENRGQFDVRDKKCCMCKQPKPIAQFAPRLDKRTGFQYYSSYCNDCLTSPEARKSKRDRYAADPQAAEKSRLRGVRWRNKHRKTPTVNVTPPIVNQIYSRREYHRAEFVRQSAYF